MTSHRLKWGPFSPNEVLVVHGAKGCGQKKPSVSVTVPPAHVWVPSQRPLAPSVASVTNDKGYNEMIQGAVYRSPGICLTAEENLLKEGGLSYCDISASTGHACDMWIEVSCMQNQMGTVPHNVTTTQDDCHLLCMAMTAVQLCPHSILGNDNG